MKNWRDYKIQNDKIHLRTSMGTSMSNFSPLTIACKLNINGIGKGCFQVTWKGHRFRRVKRRTPGTLVTTV